MKRTVFYTGWIMDIGWANLYEQVGRLPGLRIQVAIARALKCEAIDFYV